jgi:hypothetical protein
MAITRQGHADIGAMGHLTERQKGNVRMCCFCKLSA